MQLVWMMWNDSFDWHIKKLKIYSPPLIECSLKPLCSIILRIVSCSTVSNAFSKSNLRMNSSCLDWLHWCRYSKVQAKQSWIALDLMKPYWFLWISFMITFCNLSAKTLVTNFSEQLSREIGLKSLTPPGEFFLGTKVMKDVLIPCKSTASLWKSRQNW